MSDQTAIVSMNLQDTLSLSKVLTESRFFQDTTQVAQAAVKVLAGQEMGIGPVAAMTGINIIQGRVSLSANLMASLVKRSGRYDYRVKRLDTANCVIEFYQHGKSIGVSEFAADDARKAGTKNMDRYPRNMLFARAMSNGVRWYCPDITGGPAYTPEELGMNVNEDGDVVEGTASIIQPDAAPQSSPPAEKPDSTPESPSVTSADQSGWDALEGDLQRRAAAIRARILEHAADAIWKIEPDSEERAKAINRGFGIAFPIKEERHAIREYLLSHDSAGYTKGEVAVMLGWLDIAKDAEGHFVPSAACLGDAKTILAALAATTDVPATPTA